MKIPSEIHQRIVDKIQECCRIVQERTGKTINPRLSYDLRGTVAGRGGLDCGEQIVKINPVLLMENVEEMVNQTVPHEVAHVAQYVVYGTDNRMNKPHGIYWSQIMGWFGCDPRRCHSYDVTNARVRRVGRVEYVCSCRTHNISKTIVNRISMGRRYSCKHCGTVIVPKNVFGPAIEPKNFFATA